MLSEASVETILALDLRPSRFGFILLNGDVVLDWGGRQFGDSMAGAPGGLKRSLAALLRQGSPDLVLVRDRHAERDGAALRPLLDVVRDEVRQHGTKLRFLRHASVREHFPKLNKDKVAELVARRYPALRITRPSARKLWEPEDRRMAIFDAAAAALVYLKTHAKQLLPAA